MFTLTNRVLVLLLLLAAGGVAAGQEDGRRRAACPAACWTVEIDSGVRPLRLDFEYSLKFLRSHYPSGADPKSFSWEPLPKETFSHYQLLVVADGTEYVMLNYDEHSDVPQHTAVLLLRRSSEGYYQPVFIAFPELKRYDGHLVANCRHRLAYTLTMWFDGTGGISGTYLFNLHGKTRFLRSASGHRMRREDYKSDRAYEQALAEMNRQNSLASGEP